MQETYTQTVLLNQKDTLKPFCAEGRVSHKLLIIVDANKAHNYHIAFMIFGKKCMKLRKLPNSLKYIQEIIDLKSRLIEYISHK